MTAALNTSALERDAAQVNADGHAPRPGEIDGQHYFFTTLGAFHQMVEQGQMLEYAEVFGNLYGSPRAPVEAAMRDGRDTLFDVDWQGGQQIRASTLGSQVVSIFILPPTQEALRQRLNNRGQDSDEVIARRLAAAREEMSHFHEFDYVVVNEDFDAAVDELCAVFTASRLRRAQQAQRHHGLIEALLAESTPASD